MAKNDSSDKKNKMNLSNVPKDRDKEVLKNEDYEKFQIYKAIYNFAKYELKDDAIADSMHREAVAIRQQDKYSMYEDYGPKRIKKFDKNKGTQYVGIEGYADNDYEYSNAKDIDFILVKIKAYFIM